MNADIKARFERVVVRLALHPAPKIRIAPDPQYAASLRPHHCCRWLAHGSKNRRIDGAQARGSSTDKVSFEDFQVCPMRARMAPNNSRIDSKRRSSRVVCQRMAY